MSVLRQRKKRIEGADEVNIHISLDTATGVLTLEFRAVRANDLLHEVVFTREQVESLAVMLQPYLPERINGADYGQAKTKK